VRGNSKSGLAGRVGLTPALLVLPLMLSACALARASPGPEFRCDLPTANAWLTSAPEGFRDRPPIDPSQIQPVREGVDEAAATLAARSARPLTPAEAARLTGLSAPAGSAALRPWLVRAVYPVSSPLVGAAWLDSDRLVVTADGLGCAPFVKHPLVLWLDRAPGELFVVATAAL
jgi:hypothetical protein